VYSKVGIGSTFWIEIPFQPLSPGTIKPPFDTLYDEELDFEDLTNHHFGIISHTPFRNILISYFQQWDLQFEMLDAGFDPKNNSHLSLFLVDNEIETAIKLLRDLAETNQENSLIKPENPVLIFLTSVSSCSKTKQTFIAQKLEPQVKILTVPLGPHHLAKAIGSLMECSQIHQDNLIHRKLTSQSDGTQEEKPDDAEVHGLADLTPEERTEREVRAQLINCTHSKLSISSSFSSSRSCPSTLPSFSGAPSPPLTAYFHHKSCPSILSPPPSPDYSRLVVSDGQTTADPANEPPREKVLVVEDNPVNQLIMKKQLEKLQVPFQITGSGEEGVSIWESNPSLKLIFMDVEVDGKLNGLEATSLIRKMEKEKKREAVYVAVMTGRALEEDKQEGLACGCDAFLIKPVQLDKIRALVESNVFAKK